MAGSAGKAVRHDGGTPSRPAVSPRSKTADVFVRLSGAIVVVLLLTLSASAWWSATVERQVKALCSQRPAALVCSLSGADLAVAQEAAVALAAVVRCVASPSFRVTRPLPWGQPPCAQAHRRGRPV